MFLLLEETPGMGVKIMTLPVHHFCLGQGFGNMKGWIIQAQNCNRTQKKLQQPQEAGTQATCSGSGWQPRLLALHTPWGTGQGDSRSGRPTCKVMEPAFLGVAFYCILWITEEGHNCCPSCHKGVSGS